MLMMPLMIDNDTSDDEDDDDIAFVSDPSLLEHSVLIANATMIGITL